MTDETTDKDLGGRPPFEPTAAQRKQVESLSGFGIPQEEIAGLVGVCKPTLRKYFRDELDLGTAKANSMVAQSLFNKAIGNEANSVTAAIFWLKTRARWKETNVHEHSGPDGQPIQLDGVNARDLLASRIAGLVAAPTEGSDPREPE